MGIETATFIADLVAANPGAADLRSQGDDHLRLLKAVLQASFPTSSKAFYNPTTQAKSANFTVVAADMNKTFLVDTSGGAVNMTLPSLAAGDAGWECFHIKTTAGVNPVFVVPASGTVTSGAIAGMAKARRSIPGSKIRSLWTGTAWYISRAEGLGGPVGSCVELHAAALPNGFEWPSGQTLASASTAYPEFYSVNGSSGITLDTRGRVSAALDNLGGSAASRLTTAGGAIDGATFSATGGAQNVVLLTPNLPAYTPAGTITDGTISISGGTLGGTFVGGTLASAGGDFNAVRQSTTIAASQSGSTFAGTAQGGVSTAVKIAQPTIMISKILVVE